MNTVNVFTCEIIRLKNRLLAGEEIHGTTDTGKMKELIDSTMEFYNSKKSELFDTNIDFDNKNVEPPKVALISNTVDDDIDTTVLLDNDNTAWWTNSGDPIVNKSVFVNNSRRGFGFPNYDQVSEDNTSTAGIDDNDSMSDMEFDFPSPDEEEPERKSKKFSTISNISENDNLSELSLSESEYQFSDDEGTHDVDTAFAVAKLDLNKIIHERSVSII
jgi:hypothetical protein